MKEITGNLEVTKMKNFQFLKDSVKRMKTPSYRMKASICKTHIDKEFRLKVHKEFLSLSFL